MDIDAVRTSYARWSHFYDQTFGWVTMPGRRQAVAHVNNSASGRRARVLEVGVGTGLSLAHYQRNLRVTGIDASEEMLEKATARTRDLALGQVESLALMDARELQFPDDHFDFVVAMHIMSVVPEPERVLGEMARVCKPGGQVLITNHFAREKGMLAFVEKISSPFSNILGWHSDFELDRMLGEQSLKLVEQKPWPPVGMMTFLLMEKARAA